MATTYDWPASLPFSAARIAPRAISQSAGQTLSGVEAIEDSGATVWAGSITVPIRSDAQVRTLRAIRSKLRGRVNRIRFDLDAVTRTALPSGLAAVGSFSITAAAAIRDATIEIDDSGFTIGDLVGCWVSIGDDWLHEVASVDAGGSTMTINPPLRAAVTTSDTVSLSPQFVARLTADDGLALGIGVDGFGDMEFSVIEAFGR